MTRSAADADDVAQDAFERAFRGLASFNGRSSFRTWLARIVLNQSVDFNRRKSRLLPLDPTEMPSERHDEDALRDHDLIDAVLALPLSEGRWLRFATGPATRRRRSPRSSAFRLERCIRGWRAR